MPDEAWPAIAERPGEKRVTMPAMKMGVIALLLAACGLSACASQAAEGQVGASEARSAGADARRALESVDHLRSTVSHLRHELAGSRATDAAVRRRLGRLSHGLWKALGDLRGRVSETMSMAAAAANAEASAADALAQAARIGEDLSVLQQRFDYHLRHSGGR